MVNIETCGPRGQLHSVCFEPLSLAKSQESQSFENLAVSEKKKTYAAMVLLQHNLLDISSTNPGKSRVVLQLIDTCRRFALLALTLGRVQCLFSGGGSTRACNCSRPFTSSRVRQMIAQTVKWPLRVPSVARIHPASNRRIYKIYQDYTSLYQVKSGGGMGASCWNKLPLLIFVLFSSSSD